jgi:hypothetical protein
MVRSRRFRLAAARNFVRPGLAVGTFFLSAASALAQTSTTAPAPFLPYASLAGDGKTEIAGAAGAYAPVIISIVVGLACLAMLVTWLKRAKSS